MPLAPSLPYRSGSGWSVYCGDSTKLMSLPLSGYKSFVFLDPPFNIGHPYQGYDDRRGREEYESFIVKLLAGAIGQLAENGILCLHGPDHLCELYLTAMRGFTDLRRIAWINWHYRFGQCNRSNWIDSRCHCLVYTQRVSAERRLYTWNPEAVIVDSDRVAYRDKRVHETENGGKRLPGTVWGIPSDGAYWGRVQGNNEERCDHSPNQLPEVYLERLLRAYTNPGDLVLDPCAGSGTTAVVALALGRKVVAIDISQATCDGIVGRIARGAVRV